MIPGFTSTGSKRPDLLFGDWESAPVTMLRAEGCRVWDSHNREYLDATMALGAVSLGYGHPGVNRAAVQAIGDGVVGPLAPVLEGEAADRLGEMIPVEAVRFFKTGAEAVAGAVRVARVQTGRERIVTCGYQGWHDGLSDAAGVPSAVRKLRTEVPFNDVAGLNEAMADGSSIAAIVVEPVVDSIPQPSWIEALTKAHQRSGALLILDEIKTGLRLGLGGAAIRYGFAADLTVLGKALGNGFPIAAIGGPRDIMDAATRTWISSTLATESVGLAAAKAVLEIYQRENVAPRLAEVGGRLFDGLGRIADEYPRVVKERRGIPEFCYLACVDDSLSFQLARGCAARGLLFKRDAYNFVSLAHSEAVIDEILERVGDAVDELAADRATHE